METLNFKKINNVFILILNDTDIDEADFSFKKSYT